MSKATYRYEIMKWSPISLMNTYVDRLLRLKGKPDWRAQLMYEELCQRMMRNECRPFYVKPLWNHP